MAEHGGKPGHPREFNPAGDKGDDLITRSLKRVYDDVAAEPIPDELMRLLDQLDEAEEGGDD